LLVRTLEGVKSEMAHYIITDRLNNYDIHNAKDAYTYLMVECGGSMGAFGLESLDTLWGAYREKEESNKDLLNALDDLIMACELPGDHCEVAQVLEYAKQTIAKARGES